MKNEHEINAVYWYYIINWIITTPIFWYKKENLYRHISYLLITESLQKWIILNQSSWVWQFKMNRWAIKYSEYFLVYYKNLNLIQRSVWKIIYFFSKNFGETLLKNNIY